MYFTVEDVAKLEAAKESLYTDFNINPKDVLELPPGNPKPTILQIVGYEEKAKRLNALLKSLGAM